MSDASIVSPPPSIEDGGGTLSFSLEIRGGRTGFRRRPILGDRFLIGSDPVCDLRLDGRLAAPLHCLLRRDGASLEAERLGESPILVNGLPVDYAVLGSGDTLGVGPVRMVVHAHAVRFDVVRPTDEFAAPHFDAESVAASDPPRERTASELVELIEDEDERLRDFDDRRRAGTAALLEAVRRTKRPAFEAAAEGPTALDSLVTRLDQLATVLEHQAARRPVAPAEFHEASAALLAAQQELLGQADRLLRLATTLADAARPARHHVA